MPDDDREILARYLATRDVACPACGYDLRELVSPRCPECGAELELRLTLARPRQGVYINGIVALGAGVGFHALILAYIGWYYLTDGYFGPGLLQCVPLLVGLAVEGPALVVWTRSWMALQRRAGAPGWTLVGVCWIVTVASAFWFFAWAS
ncbi:MAG: hypothetical protein ACF8Q5_02975 [Phycisphaerales bacterium JB040]